jgi:hypothetical protein
MGDTMGESQMWLAAQEPAESENPQWQPGSSLA